MKRTFTTYLGGQYGIAPDTAFKIAKTNSTYTSPSMYRNNRRSIYAMPRLLTRTRVGYTSRRKRAIRYKKGLYGRLRASALRPPKPERKYLDLVFPGSGAQIMYPGAAGTNANTDAYNPFTNTGIIFSQLVGTPLTGAGILLTEGMVQGAANSQRIGRKVVIDTVHANFHFAPNFDDTKVYAEGTNPTTWVNRWNYVVRVMLIVDRNPDFSVTTGLDPVDLFEYPSSVKSGGNTWSPLRMMNAGRFQVIMDKNFHVDLDSGQRTTFKFTKRIRTPVTFTNTGGGQGSVTKNAVYLMFFHDGTDTANYATANNKDPRLIGSTRIRYFDN